MALEITGNVELDSGITLPSAYARTSYRVNDDSTSVLIVVDYWLDEASYTQGKIGITPAFNLMNNYPYNRDTDGSDVLDWTNQVIKAELEALGLSVVITEL